jgi:hypothetical protein
MYGQTNSWVLPDGDYGAFEMANGRYQWIVLAASSNAL